MKFYKYLFSLAFLFNLSIGFALAGNTMTVCPGDPVNLSWSSTNAVTCTGQASGGVDSCQYGANLYGNKSISTTNSQGQSCTVNYSCSNVGGTAADNATLIIKTLGKCQTERGGLWCPTGYEPNPAALDAGNGCKAKAPVGTLTYDNGTGPDFNAGVRYKCENAGSFSLTENGVAISASYLADVEYRLKRHRQITIKSCSQSYEPLNLTHGLVACGTV